MNIDIFRALSDKIDFREVIAIIRYGNCREEAFDINLLIILKNTAVPRPRSLESPLDVREATESHFLERLFLLDPIFTEAVLGGSLIFGDPYYLDSPSFDEATLAQIASKAKTREIQITLALLQGLEESIRLYGGGSLVSALVEKEEEEKNRKRIDEIGGPLNYCLIQVKKAIDDFKRTERKDGARTKLLRTDPSEETIGLCRKMSEEMLKNAHDKIEDYGASHDKSVLLQALVDLSYSISCYYFARYYREEKGRKIVTLSELIEKNPETMLGPIISAVRRYKRARGELEESFVRRKLEDWQKVIKAT